MKHWLTSDWLTDWLTDWLRTNFNRSNRIFETCGQSDITRRFTDWLTDDKHEKTPQTTYISYISCHLSYRYVYKGWEELHYSIIYLIFYYFFGSTVCCKYRVQQYRKITIRKLMYKSWKWKIGFKNFVIMTHFNVFVFFFSFLNQKNAFLYYGLLQKKFCFFVCNFTIIIPCLIGLLDCLFNYCKIHSIEKGVLCDVGRAPF